MAKVHGLNGLVYWGGSALAAANAWSLSFDLDTAEVPMFGDAWMTHVSGIKTWTGSVTAWYDNTEDTLWDSASSGVYKELVVYPDRNTTANYWYGNAFGSFSIDVSTGDAVSISSDLTGTSTLTKIG